jgi:hypothetical protein
VLSKRYEDEVQPMFSRCPALAGKFPRSANFFAIRAWAASFEYLIWV